MERRTARHGQLTMRQIKTTQVLFVLHFFVNNKAVIFVNRGSQTFLGHVTPKIFILLLRSPSAFTDNQLYILPCSPAIKYNKRRHIWINEWITYFKFVYKLEKQQPQQETEVKKIRALPPILSQKGAKEGTVLIISLNPLIFQISTSAQAKYNWQLTRLMWRVCLTSRT